MNEHIDKLIHTLRAVMLLATLLPVAYLLLCETGVLPSHMLAGNGRTLYFLNMAGIFLTITLVPASVRLFNKMMMHKVKSEKSLLDAIAAYRRWSIARIAMLFVVVAFNMFAYTASDYDTSPLLCAMIGLVSYFMVMPSRSRVTADLDMRDHDGETGI